MGDSVKKVLVIYKSKYGSTKRYAEWIADEAKADLMDSSQVKADDLIKYEVIIFGGSLHAVGIKGIKIISENYDKIKDKKVIVFGVGATPWREETVLQIRTANFKEHMRENISFFYLRGAFNYDKLSIGDKTLMNILKFKLQSSKEDALDEDAKGLLECYERPADWTERKAILPIIECITEVINK